ncbi:hypothetical protein U9M48_030956 [Paspalum notatum var. saurae]|uniref:Aspartic peptidase DDI1-type domain-containing protein n=1 Tax=Paspalum notatum var. saurae TaxID=547442 RepID=A0AAQ3X482_PASNO
MLTAKMDLLLKKLEDALEAMSVQALDSRMTCEHYENTGHTGSSCPGNGSEDVNFINNNSFNNGPHPQPAVNDSISKKFHANDRILETLSLQMETLNSAMKNQLSFNKMLETQIAQLAATIPSPTSGKLSGQPEPPPKEHINAVTIWGGRSTQDPPLPRNAGKEKEKPAEPEEEVAEEPQPVKEAPKSAPHEFYDTIVLPFPQRQKKTSVDDQFGKFVEVIKKLYVNIPLLDAMQVPTYAKYLKDILNNKKPLPPTEVVHLTEECSAAILNQPPQKKKDPGNPTISCSIRTQHFDQALCDMGTSVSIMAKVVFDKLTHATLAPTAMCLQLANQSIRYPNGIAEDIPVKIRNFVILVDFVVLDMEVDSKMPLILGRPFLSTTEANIDVGAGEVHLNINGRREAFAFKSKVE